MLPAKLHTIKGKAKFDELFKIAVKIKNKDCLALILSEAAQKETNPGAVCTIFYAVAVSKKTAKKAVIRNRIKRLLRESLKQLLKEEEVLFGKIGYIVLIWRWAPVSPGLIGLNVVKQSVKKILNNFQTSIANK